MLKVTKKISNVRFNFATSGHARSRLTVTTNACEGPCGGPCGVVLHDDSRLLSSSSRVGQKAGTISCVHCLVQHAVSHSMLDPVLSALF